MRYLGDEAWKTFTKGNGVGVSFKGEAFEILIRALLNASFPGSWKGTSFTRDGGKDVVDRSIPGDIAWAECKMYRRPISLQVVSNTLVMAVVEQDVRRILFFSYSDMTSNAKRYLARFALQAEKQIQVFDGERLEDLIVQSRSVMKAFFPAVDLPKKLPTKTNQPILNAHFSSDVHVRYQQLMHVEGLDKPREPNIPINTPCLYELTLIAQHTVGKLTVELEWPTDGFAHLDILNREQLDAYRRIDLEGGQTQCLPIYVSPLASGSLLLPSILLRGDKIEPIRLPAVPLKVSAFERPTLIGKNVQDTLRNFDSLISSGNTNRVFAVSGHSGIGKSRFLDEATILLLRNGYEIHYFDGLSCQHELRTRATSGQPNELAANFVRSLLSSLWRLPDPTSLARRAEDGPPNEYIAASSFGEICDVVYCWTAQKILDKADTVRAMLLRGISGGRHSLVIDNAQAFPEPVLDVLQDVFDSFVGTPGQAAMLLAFNEDDLVFNSAASAWLISIKKMHGESVRYIHLPDFSRPLAEEFIDNLFERGEDNRLFSELYPSLLDNILAKIIPRPLDLWQFAKGLEDRGAIRTGRELFAIVDLEEFHRALNSLSPDRESLLTWRMERFRSMPGAALAVSAITYFGPLSFLDIGDLIAAPEICWKLVQASILRENREHKFEFYHPSIAHHFTTDTKREILVGRDVKQALYERAAKCGASFKGSARWFGLAFDVDGDVESSLPAAIAELTDQDLTGYSPLHLAADRLLAYVSRRDDLHTCWNVLPALAGAAHVAAQGAVSVLRARADYLHGIATKISPECPTDAAMLMPWTHIIREMAGYMASAKEDSARADRLLVQSLSSLQRAKQTRDDLGIWRSEAHLLNRRCVTLKKLGCRSEALAVAQDSIEIAEAHGMIDLVCLNFVDMGYVEYGFLANNEQLLRYWKEACTRFNTSDPALGRDVHDIRLVIGLIAGCVAGLTNRFDDAIRQLDSLLVQSREREHWFYRLQGMAAKGTIMMRQVLVDAVDHREHCMQVLDLSRSLEDLAASMNQPKRYRVALYLQGKAYEKLNRLERAKERYEDALKVIVSRERDVERDAIAYDLDRLSGRCSKAPPPATTFSVNSINLPLP